MCGATPPPTDEIVLTVDAVDRGPIALIPEAVFRPSIPPPPITVAEDVIRPRLTALLLALTLQLLLLLAALPLTPPCCCWTTTTGISWERRIRFELCIFTASDTEDRSMGNGLSTVNRVRVNEHNLGSGGGVG